MRKVITARDTLVILPMTFPIAIFPPPPGLLPGGKAIRQRTFDVTPHAAEVREYVPGDPMKRIHWPSTAHRGQFMVKEFEQDPQADIWLFLDAYRPVHSSMPEPEQFLIKMTICGCAARRFPCREIHLNMLSVRRPRWQASF